MTSRPKAIGRYRVNGVLGHGAMGTVYLALDPLLMRSVAIKVLRDPEGDKSQMMARFQREAVISAKLNHPHVITVFDVGEDPEHGPFMAMEYVDGVTLTDLIREKVSPETGLRLLAQTMSALVASEAEGIAHRDVKPDNVLVGKDWRVKLMDFGIARSEGARLTQAGQIFGTPYYTAPEVLVGGDASFISDRYSFAVTAFEVLSGVLPFHGNSVGTVVYRIVHEPPEIPDSMNLAMRAVFEQALAKDPVARFPDLFTFMNALIDTVGLPEEVKPRLWHYISEVRADATEPPMGFTQSLDFERDPQASTTALTRASGSQDKTMEIPKEEEDPYDGPAYQTIVIPPVEQPIFTTQLPDLPVTQSLEEPNPLDGMDETWVDASLVLPDLVRELAPPEPPPPAQEDASPVGSWSHSAPEFPPIPEPETVILPPKEVPPPVIPMLANTRPLPVVPAALPRPIPPPVAPIKPRSRRGPLLWAGALFLVGCLAAALFLAPRRHSSAPSQALTTITSTPEGASVYIDDVRAGTTPLEQAPIPGTHSLRIEMAGFETEARKIRPEETSLHVTLKRLAFTIPVDSEPRGADVFLNDQLVGTTPMTALAVPREGRREITLRLAGYTEWRAEVDPDLPFPDRILLNPVSSRGRRR